MAPPLAPEFFERLDQRLQSLADPYAKIEAATLALGERLNVSQVGLGQVDEALERITIPPRWSHGRPMASTAWRLPHQGPQSMATLTRGDPLVILDVRQDPRTSSSDVARWWQAMGVRSAIQAPVIRNGQLSGILFVHDPEPRTWSADEVDIVRGTAERLAYAVDRGNGRGDADEAAQGLSLALDAAEMGVFEWDPQTDVVVLDARSADLLGFSNGSPPRTAKEAFAFLHSDDRERHEDQLRQAGAAGLEWRSEYRVCEPDGGVARWIEERGRTTVDARSGGPCFRAVQWDVTARKQAQARLQGLFGIRTVGVLYWDRTFRLADVNESFLHMTGFTRAEAVGKSWEELTPAEFHPASHNAVQQVLTQGEATPYEKQYFRKGGSRWWGLFAARKVGDETVEVVLDVTERREAEAALRRLNETLELQVAEEVNARLGAEEALRQSQKMEAIGQLTGGVAHDFNNLLTVIRSSAELLKRESLPLDRRQRYVAAIADTANRAAKLTAQLLAFARRQTLQPKVFNVGDRLRAIGDILRSALGSRIELEVRANCDPCFINADPTQFETALVNLAVNARDAMDGHGRLTITIDSSTGLPPIRGHAPARGKFIAVSVSDTGHGIAPELGARIFEPFFTTKDVGKGTGLGLSQVYGFAKQSGGDVEVESGPGQGAKFTLYLPQVLSPGGIAAPEEAHPDPESTDGHILVVEDNEHVGAFSIQTLAELGFETSWATNAEAALRLIRQDPTRFAAVFSDIVMPGISGIALAERLRLEYPSLPVILTSGYSHALTDEGTHGFPVLQKPYSAQDLANALRSVIRAHHRPRTAGPGT